MRIMIFRKTIFLKMYCQNIIVIFMSLSLIIILCKPGHTHICRGITHLYGFRFKMCITNILLRIR